MSKARYPMLSKLLVKSSYPMLEKILAAPIGFDNLRAENKKSEEAFEKTVKAVTDSLSAFTREYVALMDDSLGRFKLEVKKEDGSEGRMNYVFNLKTPLKRGSNSPEEIKFTLSWAPSVDPNRPSIFYHSYYLGTGDKPIAFTSVRQLEALIEKKLFQMNPNIVKEVDLEKRQEMLLEKAKQLLAKEIEAIEGLFKSLAAKKMKFGNHSEPVPLEYKFNSSYDTDNKTSDFNFRVKAVPAPSKNEDGEEVEWDSFSVLNLYLYVNGDYTDVIKNTEYNHDLGDVEMYLRSSLDDLDISEENEPYNFETIKKVVDAVRKKILRQHPMLEAA
jgi:hypothetical protein